MVKKCVINGLVAGVLFALLSWLGNTFLFEKEVPLMIYVAEGFFFAIGMGAFYYFAEKRKLDKEKEEKIEELR